MSDTKPIADLAEFAAKSPLASQNQAIRERALKSLQTYHHPQPVRRKVSDLLSAVMVLSARTRRMMQPPVNIDIDVFAPTNRRSVTMTIGGTAKRDTATR